MTEHLLCHIVKNIFPNQCLAISCYPYVVNTFADIYIYKFQVLLKTSAGEIDIELWTKETPKACRNFIQLCLEGYYNGKNI